MQSDPVVQKDGDRAVNEQATAYIAGFRYGLDVGLAIGEDFTVWVPQPAATPEALEAGQLRKTIDSQGALIVMLRRRNDWLSHLVACPQCYGYAKGTAPSLKDPCPTCQAAAGEPCTFEHGRAGRCDVGAPLYQALRDLETTRFEEGNAHVQSDA